MTKEQYLKAIRDLGLNQIQAALALGISPRQAQRLASGDSPISDTVEKLLTAFSKLGLKGAALYSRSDFQAALDRQTEYHRAYIKRHTTKGKKKANTPS